MRLSPVALTLLLSGLTAPVLDAGPRGDSRPATARPMSSSTERPMGSARLRHRKGPRMGERRFPERARAERILRYKRDKAISKLTEKRRQQLGEALDQNGTKREDARRPWRQKGSLKPNKSVAKEAPGKGRTGIKGKTTGKRRPPVMVHIQYWATSFAHALASSGADDRDYDYEGGCFPLEPDGSVDEPGTLSGNGCTFDPPPGIDPCVSAVWFPNSPKQSNGPGMVCGIDPATVEVCANDGDEALDGKPNAGRGERTVGREWVPAIDDHGMPADAVWQFTRQLRVGNGTRETLKVYLRYETTNAYGWRWYPQEAETKTLEYVLKPGEVANLKDGYWPINASKVRVWAQGQQRSYDRFKYRALSLVPECDQAGNPGYASPSLQTFNVSFR